MRNLNLKDESGQTMILTLLCMTILLGFVGFAADIGVMFHTRRKMQIAADSAAIAGASELNYLTIDNTTVQAAGQAAAAQNGVVNGTNGSVVDVHTPPLYGAFAGNAGYVEAIVTDNQPTVFASLLNFLSINVAARAVAALNAKNQTCVLILNPTASEALFLKGSFTVAAQNCGIVVDSNNSDALQFTGGAGSLTAKSVGVVGGAGGQVGDSNPPPVTGIVPVSDPLAYLTPPTPTNCTTPAKGSLTGTISPGCYSGNVTVSNATLSTGTYVFTGNVTLSGSVKTGAGGATLDIADGTLSEATNTTLDLVAPTDGAYNGIVIMEPSSNSSLLLFDLGSSSGTIDGIIYAPSAELEIHDSGGDKNGGLQLITDLIVNTLYDQTANLTITSYSQTTPTSPLKFPTLVE